MAKSECAQTPVEMCADGIDVVEQAVIHELLEHERRRARRQWIATVRAAVISR